MVRFSTAERPCLRSPNSSAPGPGHYDPLLRGRRSQSPDFTSSERSVLGTGSCGADVYYTGHMPSIGHSAMFGSATVGGNEPVADANFAKRHSQCGPSKVGCPQGPQLGLERLHGQHDIEAVTPSDTVESPHAGQYGADVLVQTSVAMAVGKAHADVSDDMDKTVLLFSDNAPQTLDFDSANSAALTLDDVNDFVASSPRDAGRRASEASLVFAPLGDIDSGVAMDQPGKQTHDGRLLTFRHSSAIDDRAYSAITGEHVDELVIVRRASLPSAMAPVRVSRNGPDVAGASSDQAGPSYYDVPSQFGSAPSAKFGQRLPTTPLTSASTPGPGAYEARPVVKRQASGGWGKPREQKPQPQTPGPGAYDHAYGSLALVRGARHTNNTNDTT